MISKAENSRQVAWFRHSPGERPARPRFWWLLVGFYTESALKDVLVLKEGNCFRKAYFPNTRFSHDLDFSTESAVEETLLRSEFNKIRPGTQSGSTAKRHRRQTA